MSKSGDIQCTFPKLKEIAEWQQTSCDVAECPMTYNKCQQIK